MKVEMLIDSICLYNNKGQELCSVFLFFKLKQTQIPLVWGSKIFTWIKDLGLIYPVHMIGEIDN